MNTMIKCLPVEVQGKLRSGVAVPSLQQCVEELILNSVDAEATCVGVRVDMEAFKIQVIDNGAGINAEDMERVGNRYHTSKCGSVEDLDDLRWYGYRGEALASVTSLATLVEISSRTRSSVKTHVKVFKGGKGMGVFEAETVRPSAGTTVIICNFFHNMPVRRKRMDAVLEGERIRQRVEAISLMHPSVSFTLKNDCTGAMMVQLPKAKSTYNRFLKIHGLERAQKLGEVSYSHGQFQVIGHIGREGHYNNSLQFLYVNERLLLRTRIHKLLNFLLRRLSGSNQKNDSPDGQSATRSPKQKRSQELHAVYIINIKCSYSGYDICLEPAKTLIEFKDWDGILLCIEEAVKAFLSKENLMAVFTQNDLECVSPKLFDTHITEQTTSTASTLDCKIGTKLASDSVHRKRKNDCVSDETVCQESAPAECTQVAEQPGQKKINSSELEKLKSEGHSEFRDEALCDPARLEPPPDIKFRKEEELTISEAGDGSKNMCMSSSFTQLECDKLELSKEREVRLSDTSSTSNLTPLDNLNQPIEPDLISTECQGTEGHGQSVVSKRRISLSDPYVHQSLQTQDPSKMTKSEFKQPILPQKCQDRFFASKRKISLGAGRGQELCKPLSPFTPSKIPRIVTCQRLSLCKETGSLEKFRRVFGKSDELKLTSEKNKPRNSHTDNFVLNCRNLSVCLKDGQDSNDVTIIEKEKARITLQNPSSVPVFTKLKPQVSGQSRGKTSLAAKLSHLKQQRTDDSKLLPHLSGATLQDSGCPGRSNSSDDGIQDGNNNQTHRDATLNPEPAPCCGTSPPLAESQEAAAPGDWLHHYDASAGKTVYVNRVTGLSRYEDPSTEEAHDVVCTSDVTNMAISVITDMGMEYRCYPFQMDIVLPFLPQARTGRVISSGLDDRDDGCERANSLTALYSKWNNPVFVRPPAVAVDISSAQAEGLAVKIHNILFPYRFSKAMIKSMKVISQADKKFLACLINTRVEEAASSAESEGNLLVLVDQHAAHERVRLESLVADSYEDDPDGPGDRRLRSSTILPPLEISVTDEQIRILRSCLPNLRSLGLEVTISKAVNPQVFVGKVPLCFMERESNELRRGRPSVIKPIVEEYLREQIELFCSTGTMGGTLPLTVLKVLASLACHGAIKFNDSLNKDECHSLVASLSCCQLPFQCAHGRPSIAPLVDFLHLEQDCKESQKPNLRKLRRMYKAWQLYGNK